MGIYLKFLADVNIEKLIVDELKKLGYDITWIAEENPSLDDISIFKIAQKENRILLTNGKDFVTIQYIFAYATTNEQNIAYRIPKGCHYYSMSLCNYS